MRKEERADTGGKFEWPSRLKALACARFFAECRGLRIAACGETFTDDSNRQILACEKTEEIKQKEIWRQCLKQSFFII